MALNTIPTAPPPFPIFMPKLPSHRPITEIRFSRWNNANAEKFIRREREQKEIEDDIRRERRFNSINRLIQNFPPEPTTSIAGNENLRPIGSPSIPSRPSIPGKFSKYSKDPKPEGTVAETHPAFRRFSKKISAIETEVDVSVGDNGVSYRVPDAPFEYQYSYTETPKVKPLGVREPLFAPFGPTTMPRPWTGRAPLPSSKKKLPEFDSFRLPPPHKKGVKPVQAPGPYLAGSGPKYVRSREEILGEPLTQEEIAELIQSCLKTRRQLNMGRDGLTHNMLENIHALWKRRRVCKIKCKGVCTVDMDNVRQQLEEKTGGKIIYSRGGVLFLFRGRNYNYKTRPRYPIMLWKPATPVYPRLIQQVPEGLTLAEATEMRKTGRKLPSICKLGRNGVFSNLVKHVREAFEECELVRINCEGMRGSDYKKIGAKLKDLVPCVLLSFEHEHILMWRGREWKSSLPKSVDDCKEAKESEICTEIYKAPNHADASQLGIATSLPKDVCMETHNTNSCSLASEGTKAEGTEDAPSLPKTDIQPPTAKPRTVDATESTSDHRMRAVDDASESTSVVINSMTTDDSNSTLLKGADDELEDMSVGAGPHLLSVPASDGITAEHELQDASGNLLHCKQLTSPGLGCTEGVKLLLQQAVENGSAVVLDDESLDANTVYERAVSLAKAAPPRPVFKKRVKNVTVQKIEKQEHGVTKVGEVVAASDKRRTVKKSSRSQRTKDFANVHSDIIPLGSLGVDEIAKLLA